MIKRFIIKKNIYRLFFFVSLKEIFFLYVERITYTYNKYMLNIIKHLRNKKLFRISNSAFTMKIYNGDKHIW